MSDEKEPTDTLPNLLDRPAAEPPPRPRTSRWGWAACVGVAALALLGGYFLRERLKSEQDNAQSARQATNDLARSLHESEEARRTLEGQVAKLQEQGQELAADRESLAQSVQEKDQALTRLQDTYSTLQSRLQASGWMWWTRFSSTPGRRR